MSLPTYEHKIRVVEDNIDALNHVNNVVYLQYINDIAVAHWAVAAPPEIHAAVIWVVRRHEIDYLQSAVLGDELLIKTWAGEYTAVTWFRHCEIRRVSDNQLLVQSKSSWVALDAVTHKFKRISGSLLAIFSE